MFNRRLTPEQAVAAAKSQRITHMLLFLIPDEDEEMNREKLMAMPTAELVQLYNDLTDKQVKRMATRDEARKRTEEALRAAGKWEETESDKPAADGSEEASVESSGKKKRSGKVSKKDQQKSMESDKPAKDKPAKDKPVKKGAPTKNFTFTLVAPNSKERNPKGLKIQPSSSRMKVLTWLESKKTPQTREQIDANFTGQKVNVAGALYFLIKNTFVKAS